MNDRATSTMLSYALTLTMITLLVSGVFVAAGSFVEDQHERAIRAELEVVGNRLAADISAVDRLAMADNSSSVELSVDLPSHLAGTSYRMEFDGTGPVSTINLSTSDPAIETTVRVKLNSTLTKTGLSGGDVTLIYDGTTLEVERA